MVKTLNASPQSFPGLRAMVVEDEALIAEELCRRLLRMGAEVVGPVASGAEAVTLAQKGVGIAIVDVRLEGDMDGIEAAAAILDRIDVPVIFLTAHADEDTIARATAIGPSGYLIKPVRERDLQMAIWLALQRQALRQSEANYRTMFNTANDAMFVHDPHTGAILDVNRRMTEMYGWTREEALGLSVQDLSADSSATTHAEALALIHRATAGDPQTFEWSARDREGRSFWVEVNLKRVELDGGVRLLAIVRDIAERKRAERQRFERAAAQLTLNALLRLTLEDLDTENLLRRALALALAGPWPRTRGAGAILLLDPATGKAGARYSAGVDPDAIARCGHEPLGYARCNDAASSSHAHYRVSIAAGETLLGLLDVHLDDQHPRDPVEESFFDGFASVLAGMLIRRRAAADLVTAARKLKEQEALAQLGRLASVFAHEIRNPLAGIRGVVQVLATRLPPDSSEMAVIREVIARVDVVDELMKDVLIFAAPVHPDLTPTDVLVLARRAVDLAKHDATASRIQFQIDGQSCIVMADRNLLKVALVGVLLNAAHAVDRDGVVRITVTSTERAARIAVADDGPGIFPGTRERIFEPFFTTKTRGAGLGLTTAKRFVEAHRGTLDVECPLDGGTLVTLEIPRGLPPA